MQYTLHVVGLSIVTPPIPPSLRFPGLWRKQASSEERKRIEDQGIISSMSTNNITLVKATEIDDIIDGIDDKVCEMNIISSWICFVRLCGARVTEVTRYVAIFEFISSDY